MIQIIPIFLDPRDRLILPVEIMNAESNAGRRRRAFPTGTLVDAPADRAAQELYRMTPLARRLRDLSSRAITIDRASPPWEDVNETSRALADVHASRQCRSSI